MLYFKRLDLQSREELECILRWENDPAIREYLRPCFSNQEPETLTYEAIYQAQANASRLCYLFGETPSEDSRPKRWLGYVELIFSHEVMMGETEHAAWLAICIGESDGRHHGYGKTAMRFIEEKAKEYGCHRIELGVFAFNDAAIALYQRMGYTEIARNENFTWHDGVQYADIRMEKRI